MRYLLLSLFFVSSLSFSADKNNYVERFESVLKESQNMVATDLEKATEVRQHWQSLLDDYPADKAVANNYAVFLMSLKKYEQAQTVIENALRYEAITKLLTDNLNKIYAFQAQKAYQTIFDDTKIVTPKGKWSAIQQSVEKDPDLAKVNALNHSLEKVANQVENWRVSWASQNLKSYLSFYKDGFIGKGVNSHKVWKAARKYSLKNPKFIKIILTNVKVVPITENLIQTEFLQNYHSNRFKDTIKKSLTWQRLQGEWKIVNERIIYN